MPKLGIHSVENLMTCPFITCGKKLTNTTVKRAGNSATKLMNLIFKNLANNKIKMAIKYPDNISPNILFVL